MDDDELVAAVAAGDDAALRELFGRHAAWVWAGRPVGDLGAALCPVALFGAGVAAVTVFGARDAGRFRVPG